MPCNNQQPQTTEKEHAAGTAQRESALSCPCGGCPENAKWLCLAGLAAALGFVAFRTLRHAAASS